MNTTDLDIVEEMLEYAGKEAIVINVDDGEFYELDIDGGDWTWSEGMFESICEKDKPNDLIAGDLVKIREDLCPCKYYNDEMVTSDMLEYRGKVAKIVKVEYDECADRIDYELDIDEGHWNWTKDMFEWELDEVEDENSAEDNSLLDYALQQLGVTKEELIKMKEKGEDKRKIKEMTKKILMTYEDLDYVAEDKCGEYVECDDCPYYNDKISCRHMIFLCHLMEEGKLVL